jgi:hypothetical protein
MKQKLWYRKVGVRGKGWERAIFSCKKEALQFVNWFLLHSRTFIFMNVHLLHCGVRISHWFCLVHGINDIYILNRKNVQQPLHVISNTHNLKLTILALKNRSVLTTVSYHIFNFTLLLAANQMTNISHNCISFAEIFMLVVVTMVKKTTKMKLVTNIFGWCTKV